MGTSSPEDMMQALEAVDQLRKFGIDFVAVPVRDKQHRKELIQQGYEVLEELERKSKGKET